jgi:hypothetical protein
MFLCPVKSFAYDLDVQRGIVSGRVALLLRSAEIQPLLSGFRLQFVDVAQQHHTNMSGAAANADVANTSGAAAKCSVAISRREIQ